MTAPPINVRPATAADFAALCELWIEIGQYNQAARPDMFHVDLGLPRSPAWFEQVLAAKDMDILVAEAPDGAIRGLIVLAKSERAANRDRIASRFVEIQDLVVTSSARRQGVATALLDAARAWTAARSVRRIELNVYEFNDVAQTLYEAEGYATVSRRMSLNV
jgi:ribosomal protein S18 acetylase RimI-like enzyme